MSPQNYTMAQAIAWLTIGFWFGALSGLVFLAHTETQLMKMWDRRQAMSEAEMRKREGDPNKN